MLFHFRDLQLLWALGFLHFHGNVGAAKFTQPAGIAILQACDHRFLMLIKFKDLLGTEGNADPATLAQISVDFQGNDLFSRTFFGWLFHKSARLFSVPLLASQKVPSGIPTRVDLENFSAPREKVTG
jgi:hypothetical protein